MNKQEYIDTAEQELLHTIVFHLYLIMVRAYTFTIQTKKRIWISQPESPYVRWAIAMRRIKMR